MLPLFVLLCRASFLNRWVVKTIGRPRAAPRSRPRRRVFFLARFSRRLLRHVDERGASVLLRRVSFPKHHGRGDFSSPRSRSHRDGDRERERKTERARACTRERRLVVSARRTVQRFGPAHRSETTAAATR